MRPIPRPLALLLLVLLSLGLLGACRALRTPGETPPSSNPTPGLGPEAGGRPPSPTSPPTAQLPAPTSNLPSPLEATPLSVTDFPDPGAYTWQLVVDGLTRPLDLAHGGDGSGRLFVLEQPGLIRVIQDGMLAPTPFLDLRDRVGSQANEQGLLGIAFHPRYVENGYFYLNYTDRRSDTIIARYQVSADPDRADPASELRLLKCLVDFRLLG